MSGTFLINKKIFDPDVTLDSKGRVTDMSFNSTINILHCPDMDTQNMVIKNTLDVSKVDVSNCFILPVGIENDRVTEPGSIRFNTDTKQFEGCDDTNQWGALGGGAWSEVNPGEIRLTTDLNYNKVADIKDVTISGTGLAPTVVSTDNSTKIATTAFVQTAVAGIVDSAPETLNTLNELATALGDDPNYTTTITTKLGQIDVSFVVVDSSFAVVDASFVSVTNDINNLNSSKHPLIDASNRLNANLIADGSVDNTEFQYLDGTTGNIQLQINELDVSANLQEKHINAYTSKTINVTVKPKTPSHPNIGQGSAECYYFDNVETPIIMLIPGITYIFDQSEPTNANHPLRFYEDEQKGLIYNEGVTSTGLGTEGNPGAYTQIIVTKKTKMRLFYQCFHHPLMGGKALVYNSENYEYFYSKDASFNDVYINNDLHVKNDISCNNVIVSGHSFKDLSGTVTNLINRPVGIWSEVNTDEIRLTTSSDYGKLVDISGLKITNNVEVLGDISCNDVSCNGILNVDTINEITSASGVTIESVLLKDQNVTAHTISAQNYAVGNVNFISASRQGNFRDLEVKNSSNTETILLTGDGGHISINGTLSADTINEKTNATGVTIDSVLLKDNNVTAHTISAQNYAVGGTNFISATRQGNFRDVEVKDNTNTDTILLTGTGGHISINGTLSANTINEKTSASGVTIENVLFKDGDISCNGQLHVSGDISCNNINIGSNSFTDLSNNISKLDISYVDLSGTVTTNITNISTNATNISGNTSSFTNRKIIVDNSFNDLSNNISKLDISYVDLSGTVTNLINQPVGIWSEVTTDEIRLTTSGNYGKLVDISGMDISNNLHVKGNVTVGYGGITDVSGTLRYTDLSKVEVFHDGIWNQIAGGVWSDLEENNIIRLTEDEDYDKKVEIYNLDISNNLDINNNITVGGNINLSGGIYNDGFLYSLDSSSNQIVENIIGKCQGQSIVGNKATYALPNVTKQIPTSGNYFSSWTDISGSKINYIPPINSKYVKYSFRFVYGKTLFDDNLMTKVRFLIDGTDISNVEIQLNKEQQNNYYTFETVIRIDNSLSGNDVNNSIFKTWDTAKELKLQIKEFNQPVGSYSWLHNMYSWNNGAPTNSLIKPIMDLQTIGIKIYKIDVVDISNNAQRILDLSGNVTDLINQPSGIWSDVDSNNIIRLTTASDYGKRLDISAADISNNLTVKGTVSVGYGGTTDISGTLRYTDLSKVEVFHDGIWNQIAGGVWSDETNNGIIRLTEDEDYDKNLDISGMDISNNLTVKGKFNLSGDLYKNGTLVSLNSEIIQVIENIAGLSDGQSILGNQGTYTLPDVTKQTPVSGNYFSDWTDISGSKIEYKPPPGAKYIKYVYKFAYGKTLYDEQMMTNIRFLIGNTVITSTMKQLTKEKQNNYYTFETIIRIDSTLSSDDLQNLAIKDWTANRTLKIQIKEFNQVVGSQSWLHNIHSWENGAPVNKVSKPTMDVMVVGNLIQKIDVSEITKLISISGETIQMVENIAGLAEGQTLDGFQSNYTLENVTAKQTPSSGTYFSTWHDILGSKLSYKPPENSPIVKYSFKFAYGKKLFDDNLMTNIRFLLGGTVVTNTEIQLNKDNQNNQYTFDCIIRIDDTLSSDDVANSKLKTWTTNKEMKLQIKEFNNDVGNESWLHNFYSWENGAPVNKVIKPTLDIQAMGYLTRIITDISSGIWGEVNTNEIRMMDSTNYDKKLDVSGIDVSNNLVVDGIFSLNGRFNTHLLPTTNAAYDLGNAEYKIRHLFLSDNSLWIGDEHKIDVSGGKMKFKKRNKNKVPQSLLNTGKDESTILNEIFGPGHGKTIQNVALHQWYEYAARPGINISNELLFSSTGLGDGVDDFLADIESSDSLLIQNVDQTILGTKTFTNIIISGEGTASTQTSGDNSTKIATTAYVKSEIDNLIGGAPSALNTLKELADVLGDDANFSGTIINRLTQVDTSCNDLSGVVTANIASIAANESNISSNATNISGNTSSFNDRKTIVDSSFNDLSNNISELDISYVDLSGVVTTNIADITSNTTNISTNTSNITSNTNNKAPINDPTFTGTVNGVTASHVGLGYVTNESKSTMFSNPTFTGNVGIGTTSTRKLSVSGTSRFNNIEIMPTGEYSDWSYAPGGSNFPHNDGATYGQIWSIDNKSGASYPLNEQGHLVIQPRINAGRNVFFRTGGADDVNNENITMTIKHDGNVGIGTTDPGSFKLNVNGIIQTKRDIDGMGALYINNSYIWGGLNDDITIHNDYSEKNIVFRLTTAQNVDRTAGKFELSGATTRFVTHQENNDANVNRSVIRTESAIGSLSLNSVNKGSGASYTSYQYNSISWYGGSVNTDTKAKLHFQYKQGDTDGYTSGTHMTITGDGNVGIGTTDPGYPLEISNPTTSVDPEEGWGYHDWGNAARAESAGADRSIGIRVNSGGIWTNNDGYFVSSDQRIKENIRDVSDNDALQKLRDISCVYYEYKDKIRRGIDSSIGFIAQQVKEHIPMAVSLQKSIIPSEMRILTNYSWNTLTDASNNNTYKLTVNDLSDNSGNRLYSFYVSNDPSGNDEIKKEIKSMEDDPKSFVFDQQWTSIFLYGKQVEDFHILDKQKLFALNFSATQEIDRIQQSQQTTINNQQTTINNQQTTINNQQTTINTLQTTLTALEARIAALENP